MQDNSALDFILGRRSIREFTEQPVGDDDVRLLLEAAMAAPSAHNLQPWHFIVVREAETRGALAATHEFSGMASRSPVVIAVCADPNRSVHWLEDGCLAAGQMLIAASALGLGAVWVAIYPHEEHEAFVRGVLDIPEEIRVICLVPVGHPAERKSANSKFDPGKVHRERFETG